MIKASMSREESILHNLDTWCYEVGSEFEEFGRQAALEFIKYITKPNVLELGCGDGSSTKIFTDNGIKVLAMDINPEKLSKLEKPAVGWETDMLEGLETLKDKTVDNIFSHHSLEHVVHVEDVLEEVSRVMRHKGLFYASVPSKDSLHSVHHVVFNDPTELLPEGFKPIIMNERERTYGELTWSEYICVAQKLWK